MIFESLSAVPLARGACVIPFQVEQRCGSDIMKGFFEILITIS